MPKHIALTALSAAVLTITVQQANAGFLDRLFGAITRTFAPPSERPPDVLSPAPPPGGDMRLRPEAGPRSAYCVRTCDGHYFPVQAQANMSAAQMCQTFCPAAETKLFAGGGIDYAVAPDGTHYRDLPNAFLYRKQLVAGCTCNGKDAFGLARLNLNNDPTLAPGDIVGTEKGLATVTGRNQNGPQFTTIDPSRVFPQVSRGRNAETRNVRPSSPPVDLPPQPDDAEGSAAGAD